MEDVRPTLGVAGEDAAWRVYRDLGYRLVARNWRCRLGELDLIVARGEVLVICEVKTRRGAGFGGGWEAVTARKQQKVRAVAEAFLQTSDVLPLAMRFDVASVALRASGRTSVELFEDAF